MKNLLYRIVNMQEHTTIICMTVLEIWILYLREISLNVLKITMILKKVLCWYKNYVFRNITDSIYNISNRF